MRSLSYSTKARWDFIRRCLHNANESRNEAHLHGSLASFNLGKLLEDVLR